MTGSACNVNALEVHKWLDLADFALIWGGKDA